MPWNAAEPHNSGVIPSGILVDPLHSSRCRVRLVYQLAHETRHPPHSRRRSRLVAWPARHWQAKRLQDVADRPAIRTRSSGLVEIEPAIAFGSIQQRCSQLERHSVPLHVARCGFSASRLLAHSCIDSMGPRCRRGRRKANQSSRTAQPFAALGLSGYHASRTNRLSSRPERGSAQMPGSRSALGPGSRTSRLSWRNMAGIGERDRRTCHGRRQQGQRTAAGAVDAGDAGRLHAGLRQRLRDRGAAGRAAAWARTRRSAAPTGSMPSSSRARPSRRRAAPTSAPGSTASARRCSTRGRFKQIDAALLEDRAVPRRARPAARPAALGPGADPEGAAHLPHRHAHHDHGGRRQHAGRHGGARLSRHPVDGERLLLQRRRRAADRAAAGRAALLHRVRHDRGRARRDLRHPARRQVQGRAARRPGARLRVRELRRQVHAARPRADRRQLPRQRARLQDAGGGLRGQGGAVAG